MKVILDSVWIATIVLIILKVTNAAAISWWVAFSPTLIYLTTIIVLVILTAIVSVLCEKGKAK